MVGVGNINSSSLKRCLLCMVAISITAIAIVATTVRASPNDIVEPTSQASPDLSAMPVPGGVTTHGAGPDNGKALPYAAITAGGMVLRLRLIVVDEHDRIVEIWSNTPASTPPFYSLQAREGSRQGPAHPLTQEILAQYNRLLTEVDWSNGGQVY